MRTTLTIMAVACGGIAFFPGSSAGQEPVRRVSMAEALRLFGENSLVLRIARAEELAIRGDARQASAYFNPALNVVREDLGSGSADYSETVVGLAQQLEWPGRTAARKRAADRRADAASASFRADSIRLAFDVRRAWIDAWAAETSAEALRRAATLVAAAVEAAERRLEEGDISGYEVRRLRLERVRVESEVAAAELEVAETRRTLATFLLPEPDASEIAASGGPEGELPAIGREAALETIADRPDLKAASLALEAARAAASVAGTDWVPSPKLTVGYKDQSDGLSGAALGLSLPLPLFDRGGGAARRERARAAGAAATLALRRRHARNDAITTADRYASRRDRLSLVGEALPADAEALLEAARTAYEEGEMSLLALLDAVRAFREAHLSAIELRADAWIAYYDLLRAMGRAPEEDR